LIYEAVLADAARLERLENRRHVRAWEGGYAFTAHLAGRAVFVIDESALADFVDASEEHAFGRCRVRVFESVAARDDAVRRWLAPRQLLDREDDLVRRFRDGSVSEAAFAAELKCLRREAVCGGRGNGCEREQAQNLYS
jgi:hypothetical protein